MANIIRIRNLDPEYNIQDVLIPVDKNSASYDRAKIITATDLKEWILSGYTGGGGTGITSGTSGTDGTSGTSPCIVLTSNTITIRLTGGCELDGCYEDCTLEVCYEIINLTTTTTTNAGTTTTTTNAGTTTTSTTFIGYLYIGNRLSCGGCVTIETDVNILSDIILEPGKYYINASNSEIFYVNQTGGTGSVEYFSCIGPYDTCNEISCT